jgi:hypothetical protein
VAAQRCQPVSVFGFVDLALGEALGEHLFRCGLWRELGGWLLRAGQGADAQHRAGDHNAQKVTMPIPIRSHAQPLT